MKALEFIELIDPRSRDEFVDRLDVVEEQPHVFEEDELPPTPPAALGLVEMILKNRNRLHAAIRRSPWRSELVPRLLAISLAGFVFFGIAMSIVLHSSGTWPRLFAVKDVLDGEAPVLMTFPVLGDAAASSSNPWLNGAAFKLVAAYSIGLIAATGICLPSLYFYGLLAGIKMSMLDVTIHALKCKATSAVALVGILPIYAAASMGMVIFGASPVLMQATLIVGLLLPFFAGVWGINSMYAGFSGLCDTLPEDRRVRRACFLRRLVLSWSACYTAIMPVMIFTLWQAM